MRNKTKLKRQNNNLEQVMIKKTKQILKNQFKQNEYLLKNQTKLFNKIINHIF